MRTRNKASYRDNTYFFGLRTNLVTLSCFLMMLSLSNTTFAQVSTMTSCSFPLTDPDNYFCNGDVEVGMDGTEWENTAQPYNSMLNCNNNADGYSIADNWCAHYRKISVVSADIPGIGPESFAYSVEREPLSMFSPFLNPYSTGDNHRMLRQGFSYSCGPGLIRSSLFTKICMPLEAGATYKLEFDAGIRRGNDLPQQQEIQPDAYFSATAATQAVIGSAPVPTGYLSWDKTEVQVKVPFGNDPDVINWSQLELFITVPEDDHNPYNTILLYNQLKDGYNGEAEDKHFEYEVFTDNFRFTKVSPDVVPVITVCTGEDVELPWEEITPFEEYTFEWNNTPSFGGLVDGNGLSEDASNTNTSIGNSAITESGIYTVTVAGPNGCSHTKSVEVEIEYATLDVNYQASCTGTDDGSASPNLNNPEGLSVSSFEFFNAADELVGGGMGASNLAPGDYYLVANVGEACVLTEPFTIEANVAPILNLTDQTLCSQSGNILFPNLTGGDLTISDDAVSYTWDNYSGTTNHPNPGQLGVNNTGQLEVPGDEPGTWTVVVTDEHGCESTGEVSLILDQITLPSVAAVCSGSELFWLPSVNIFSSDHYTFIWSNGYYGEVINGGMQASTWGGDPSPTIDGQTDLTVTVTNSETGACNTDTYTATLSVGVISPPVGQITLPSVPDVCSGSELFWLPSVNIFPSDHYTFIWSNGFYGEVINGGMEASTWGGDP
ncbi:MAG: hypothetical protein HRT72_02295, partial [Flavobacteriales bacterium]|nr:hypothetical protein [Flavobacteriales bacterium]